MIYVVSIKQDIRYTETIVAKFNDIHEMEVFIRMIVKCCKNVSINIEIEEVETEPNADTDAEEDDCK